MSIPQAAARPSPRRSDAGRVRLQQRDIDGLLLVAEHYAAPYDLLSAALAVTPPRLRGITARWRAAGLASTGLLGPGPAWCWLTPAGMAACGHRWPAGPPSLARLAHIRAVLAARIELESAPGYAGAGAWWHAERRIRAALPSNAAAPHIADAEIHWPSAPPGPHAGQVWAVEVELTPKTAARTARIMAGLLARPGYARVVYLTSPAARPVVTVTAGRLHDAQRGRVEVRDLPPSAFLPVPGGPPRERADGTAGR
ncbi:MAG TPA: hypothetical protein VHF26_01505 [Trebonia sp.]|nr:hypothetical protein [Trebonia sp.]